MKDRRIVLTGVAMLLAAQHVFAQDTGAPGGGSASTIASLLDDGAAREMNRKQELIPQILGARETASGRKMSGALRGKLAGLLLQAPVAALESFAAAGGLGNIESLLTTNALGDSAADLVFTPVAPCRIINTTVLGGVIPANTTRSFFVNGTTAGTFETQGGTAGGCGIPDEATAVAMNFVAVGPAGPGDLRAFPWSATPTPPTASVINYANVTNLNIANAIAQPVCNAATTTCTFDLIVQADVAATHLVVDVVGYYRNVNKGQYRTFAVSNRVNTGFPAFPAGCTNVGGLSVALTAPVAGTVFVDAGVIYFYSHTLGTQDQVNGFIGTTATECLNNFGDVSVNLLPAGAPTSSFWGINTYARRTVSVAAGSTTTFFVNSLQVSGGTDDLFGHGSIKAIFVPN